MSWHIGGCIWLHMLKCCLKHFINKTFVLLTFVRMCACSESTCICKFVNSFSPLLTVLCIYGHVGMSVFYCHDHWRGRWERCTFFRQTKHCLLLFGIISNPFRLSANFVICVVIDILAGISCCWDLLQPRSNVYLLFDVSDDSTEGILERSMTTGCTPIPKIAIQEEKEDFIRKEFGKASRTKELFWLFYFWYSFSVCSWLKLGRSCDLEVGTLCLCG